MVDIDLNTAAMYTLSCIPDYGQVQSKTCSNTVVLCIQTAFFHFCRDETKKNEKSSLATRTC